MYTAPNTIMKSPPIAYRRRSSGSDRCPPTVFASARGLSDRGVKLRALGIMRRKTITQSTAIRPTAPSAARQPHSWATQPVTMRPLMPPTLLPATNSPIAATSAFGRTSSARYAIADAETGECRALHGAQRHQPLHVRRERHQQPDHDRDQQRGGHHRASAEPLGQRAQRQYEQGQRARRRRDRPAGLARRHTEVGGDGGQQGLRGVEEGEGRDSGGEEREAHPAVAGVARGETRIRR